MSHVASLGPNDKTGNLEFADIFTATGTITLNGTTAVSTALTSVAAGSVILLAYKTPAGTPGAAYVSAKTAGVGFDVKSVASDTSVIQYYVL